MQVPEGEKLIYVIFLAHRLCDIYISKIDRDLDYPAWSALKRIAQSLSNDINCLPEDIFKNINKNIDKIIEFADLPAPCYDINRQIFENRNYDNIKSSIKSLVEDESKIEDLKAEFIKGGEDALELANNKQLARINWLKCAKNYIEPSQYHKNKREILVFKKQNLSAIDLTLNRYK